MARPSNKAKKEAPTGSLTLPEGFHLEGDLKIRPHETIAERKHRLWKDARSFWIKDASVYIVALAILVTTTIYCFWVLWHPSFAKEDRQWAMSTLTALLVGIVGYVFGKATK